MSALLESIALSYAKTLGLNYITDEAREYAAKKLGIDTQKGNPKYALSLRGQSYNPFNMLKNVGLNKGISSIFGSGSNIAAPLAAASGLIFLANKTNPLREGSYNYNPNLRGELDYAGGAGLLARNPNSGLLIYGSNSVLSGKSAVHGGRNVGYSRDLQEFINKQQAIKNRGYNKYSNIPFTETQQKRLDKAKKEIENLTTHEFDQIDADREKEKNRKTYSPPYQGKVHDSGGGRGDTESQTNSQQGPAYDFARGGRARYARGGIASL